MDLDKLRTGIYNFLYENGFRMENKNWKTFKKLLVEYCNAYSENTKTKANESTTIKDVVINPKQPKPILRKTKDEPFFNHDFLQK